MASESASGIPPDDREFIPDEFDQIRWGTNNPESPLVDQAGIPSYRPPAKAMRTSMRRTTPHNGTGTRQEASEFDPSRQGVCRSATSGAP